MSTRSAKAAAVRLVGPYVLSAALGGLAVWYFMATPTPDNSSRASVRHTLSRSAWTTPPEPEFPLPPYAHFLEGVRIVLDPGHGGRGERKGWKRGPTGLREAEVNLRVALILRDYLESAGARVALTRDSDVYLDRNAKADLRKRIEMANRMRADLFLSIHHNGANSPDANYTTVFYHATPDHSPASLDVARCLLTGLSGALRLEQHLNCGIVSDYALYPDEGFAVLRQAEVPAVLSEASFHSNPGEEQRLRDPAYNRREAYGLFLGLARWAQGGLPRVSLIPPAQSEGMPADQVAVLFDDGLARRGGLGMHLPQLRRDSLVVELGGRPVPYTLDLAKHRLLIEPPREDRERGGRLRVDFANVFGQHVLHPWIPLAAGGHRG